MILSGKDLAKEIKLEIKDKIQRNYWGLVPTLEVIIVGNDPASEVYVKQKEKACKEIGINSKITKFDINISEEELLNYIKQLNQNNNINGILVQLPLPKDIREQKVLETIAKEKDVDGFHPLNVANLWQKIPCTIACTPKGILRLIDETKIDLTGKKAVIIGRSNIVGLPVSKLLLDRNCTVTICHSKTKNLKEECLSADILVVAIGRANFVTSDMVKDGAIVIDVGINRVDGKLYGDVDFENVKDKCSFITPVPGGVGPMTIACLMENTFEVFKNQGYYMEDLKNVSKI